MNPLRSLRAAQATLLLTIGALTLLLVGPVRAQGTPVPAPLGELIPALGEQSSWEQDTRYEGPKPDKKKRGVYPVGNGVVFGYQGLGQRANTLQGLTGPGYKTPSGQGPRGHFGESTLELRANGTPLDLPVQRVRRVRGANFVVSEDAQEKGITLRVLTFAAPGAPTITRIVEIRNEGTTPATGLSLTANLEGGTISDGSLTKISGADAEARALAMRFDHGKAQDGMLVEELAPLAPGAATRRVLTLETATGKTAPKAIGSLIDAGAAADATLKSWQQQLASTTRIDTDHKKLKDLIEDWKVLNLVQRDARSGLVVPMVGKRGFRLRESVGPMLMFLRFNQWAEAKHLLEWIHDATRLLGEVPNEAPLDLDFAPLAGKETDWDAIRVQDSEIPSWVILLHFWYWRITQDIDLIEKHWPLLEICLKKQRRDPDGSLMTFQGDEAQLAGAFASLYPDRLAKDPFLVADDAAQGRKTFSLMNGVMFLIAMQGMGEMVDGLDKKKNPSAWELEKPAVRPGQRYVERTFKIMAEIEQKYWLVDKGREYFAPAISPVNRKQHEAPFADFNLSPLWLGWTFPTGEKSRDNLRNSLALLPWTGARVGMTPTVRKTTGFTQAMLLTALSERDCKDRLDAFDVVLKLAEPAGEWGELYDEDGRPIAGYDLEWPNRCLPWESGVNLDALLFGITGIRYVSVPNWDNSDIRLELRVPHGAKFVTLRDQKKDGRHIEIYMNETFAKLTDEERKANEQKKPEERRDPQQDYRRLKFRVELLSENPKRGYYDVGCNAMGTMYVRYLWKAQPVAEVEFWTEDKEVFLPEKASDQPWPFQTPVAQTGADLLFLGARSVGAELVGKDKVTVVDTGLPMQPAMLANLLVDAKGALVHKSLFVDHGADQPGRATLKTSAFWTDPAWTGALTRFRELGGKVLSAGYVELAGSGDKETTTKLVATSTKACEVVLRVGNSRGIRVRRGDAEIFAAAAAGAMPDTGSVLLKLPEGKTELTVVLEKGEAKAWLRLTDPRGLPVDGVSLGR